MEPGSVATCGVGLTIRREFLLRTDELIG
jgi:hypothetical protein